MQSFSFLLLIVPSTFFSVGKDSIGRLNRFESLWRGGRVLVGMSFEEKSKILSAEFGEGTSRVNGENVVESHI